MENNKDTLRTSEKVLLIILGVIVIFFVTNIPLLIMHSDDISIDSSVKISSFEVINFAIAIWASLNIANYFDRKEFEKYKQTSKNEMDKFKDEQIIVTKEINEKNALLSDIFYAQFLQELLITIENPISEKFYKVFSEKEKDNYPFEVLLIVERLYAQVYQLYYSNDEGIDFNCIKMVSQKGIDSMPIPKPE